MAVLKSFNIYFYAGAVNQTFLNYMSLIYIYYTYQPSINHSKDSPGIFYNSSQYSFYL